MPPIPMPFCSAIRPLGSAGFDSRADDVAREETDWAAVWARVAPVDLPWPATWSPGQPDPTA